MKTVAKIIKNLFIAVLILLLLQNTVFLFQKTVLEKDLPSVFGLSYLVVTSGSMSPAVQTGEIIVIKSEDNYNIGDVITFRDKSSFVTHRISDISENGFITKGDANNIADSEPVAAQNVCGKVVFHSVALGKIVDFTTAPFGVLCILLLVILIYFTPSVYKK